MQYLNFHALYLSPLFRIHPTWSGWPICSKIFWPCLIAPETALPLLPLLPLTASCDVGLPGEVDGAAETVRLRKVAGSRLGDSVPFSLEGESYVPTEMASFGDPLGVEGRCDCEEDLRVPVPPRRGRLNLLDFSVE